MLDELYELLEEVTQRGHWAPFLMGLGCAAVPALFTIIKLLQHRPTELIRELRGQIDSLKNENQRLEREVEQAETRVDVARGERDHSIAEAKRLEGQCEALRQSLTETSEACERLAHDRAELDQYIKKLRRQRDQLRHQVDSLIEQLNQIETDDGKVWLRPTQGEVPDFLPMPMRKTPIISVANLKGGVGKTTITANLGAAFAADGARVLLIDLDHQSSLSSLCMSAQELYEVKRRGLTVSRFFEQQGGLNDLNASTTPLEVDGLPGRLFLAPADEPFGDLENQLVHRWAAGIVATDARFILRSALHDPMLHEYYDLVIIDCPPRLTTGCVNALAASDYVLVPVLLQDISAEAVPRMLSWLKRFQECASCHLDLLGIIGNRAFPREKLISREGVVWTTLRDRCSEAWGEHTRLFDEIIREHATYSGRFAALDPKHQPRYGRLAQQIQEVIPYARLKPATVHSTARPTPNGYGDQPDGRE